MVFAENVESQRVVAVLQRTETEVLAYTCHLSQILTPVIWAIFFERDVILALSLLVEDHDTRLSLFIGTCEIAPLHYLNTHHTEEIVSHRITLEVDGISLIFATPAHAADIHYLTVRPCEIHDVGIVAQLVLEGIVPVAPPAHTVRQMSRDEIFLVKTHVIIHHVAVLQAHEDSADYESNRDGELHANEQIAETASHARCAEAAFEHQCRLERSDIECREDAACNSTDQHHGNGQYHYRNIDVCIKWSRQYLHHR